MAETILRWPSLKYNARLNNRIRDFYKQFYAASSFNRHEDLGKNQRGGTCIFSVQDTTHRTTTSGIDPTGLGRWSWIQVSGRNGLHIRIISAYRPCRVTNSTGLTTNWDQQLRYFRKNNQRDDPLYHFDHDLFQEIDEWLENGTRILLCIDANEDVTSGPFITRATQSGLFNVHSTLHDNPLPPTHNRGSKPISAMLASYGLTPSRCGILENGQGIEGDHRNMFVDFPQDNFLGDEIYKVPPPTQRRLQLYDSRIVDRFNTAVLSHLTQNNIHNITMQMLQQSTFPPPDKMQDKMDKLDDQIGRAIAHGEKVCRKLRNGDIPFSAEYVRLNKHRRFWKLLLLRRYGRRISYTTIRRLAKSTGNRDYHIIDTTEAKFRLKRARINFYAFVKNNAKSEREIFIERLAAANAAKNNLKKGSVLRRILHEEDQRIQNRKMSGTFKKTKMQRLDSVEVFHNGEWVEVTQPTNLTEAIRQENNRKYSSTNNTPLMEKSYHESLGYLGELVGANDVLNGTYAFPPHADRYERDMLQYLARTEGAQDLPVLVTDEEYQTAWRVVKEKRSSSLSGRHFGVYKAVTNHPDLLPIFTAAYNIPFVNGLAYNRWSNFLNVMTFKEEGVRKVDRLRTLVLGEGDWNMGGRIHVNRRMFRQAEKLGEIPPEHFGGRRGYKAIDAVISKRLVLDNIRLSKRPAAVISTDAANCYDRMVHSFVSLSARRLGLALSVILALLRPLQESRHFIRTAYGDSSTYYGGQRDVPYQGTGQGNSSSSPFWTIVSSIMIKFMKDTTVCASFTTSLTLTCFILTMVMYVNDNDIFVTSSSTYPEADIIAKAQRVVTIWKKTLNVTGGVVRPIKYSWVFIQFKWIDNEVQYMTSNDLPGTIHLEDDDGTMVALQRTEPDVGVKSLGVITTTNGSEQKQLERMHGFITQWTVAMNAGRLPHSLNFQAMTTRINRILSYHLPATSLTETQCKGLESALYRTTLPRCGISEKLPLAIRYATPRYLGLGIPRFLQHQGLSHLREFVKHNHGSTIFAQQLQTSLELIQTIIGTQSWCFSYPSTHYAKLVDTCWTRTLWEFTSSHNIEIQSKHTRIETPRHQDSFLMEDFVASGVTHDTLKRLNACRLYLQVITVSDICDAAGRMILEESLHGRLTRDRVSSFKWPIQPRPSQRAWKAWRDTLHRLYTRDASVRLRTTLGPWVAHSHQKWIWFFDKVNGIVYRRDGNTYTRYTKDLSMRLPTRTAGTWFKKFNMARIVEKKYVCLCTVTRQTGNHILMTSYYAESINPLRPTTYTYPRGS